MALGGKSCPGAFSKQIANDFAICGGLDGVLEQIPVMHNRVVEVDALKGRTIPLLLLEPFNRVRGRAR